MKYYKINLAESIEHKDVDVREIKTLTPDLVQLMLTIKKEIKWKGMYSKKDAIQRFKDGCICMLLYENNNPIGLRWFYDVRPNIYSFNLFISKKRKDGISHKFYETTNNIFYKKGYENLIAYCDDWNKKMWYRAFKMKGFQSISIHIFRDMIGAAKKKIYF